MKFLRRAEYAGVFLLAVAFYAQSDASWWLYFLLFLVPDLTMLGYLGGNRTGALVYNIGHSFIGAFVLAGFAMVTKQPWLFPFALIWTAHIALDRMLGFGLKYASGFQDTHMGRIGRDKAAG